MEYDDIKLDEFGEIDSVNLSKETSNELEQTGYAMVNDPILSGQYFIIKVDDGYYLTKAVGFNIINHNC
jgi:hypothetical protein